MAECADTVTVLVLTDQRTPIRRYVADAPDTHEVRVATSAADIDDTVDVVVTDTVPDRQPDGYGVVLVTDAPASVTRDSADIALSTSASADRIRCAVDRLHRRTAYVNAIDSLFDLCERRAELLEENGASNVPDEFEHVNDRIRDRRECTDSLAAELDEEDYRATFRAID